MMIRLIEFDGYREKLYRIQEFIPKGKYEDMEGWCNRDAPIPESSLECAISLFNKYKKNVIPHPPWPSDYIPMCGLKVLMQRCRNSLKILTDSPRFTIEQFNHITGKIKNEKINPAKITIHISNADIIGKLFRDSCISG